MHEHEVEEIVERTVKTTLLTLGIDVSNPLELQADMQHVRKHRQAQETIKKHVLLVAIGAVTIAGLGAVWLAVTSWVRGS